MFRDVSYQFWSEPAMMTAFAAILGFLGAVIAAVIAAFAEKGKQLKAVLWTIGVMSVFCVVIILVTHYIYRHSVEIPSFLGADTVEVHKKLDEKFEQNGISYNVAVYEEGSEDIWATLFFPAGQTVSISENWRVIKQEPSPGTAVDKEHVELKLIFRKTGEDDFLGRYESVFDPNEYKECKYEGEYGFVFAYPEGLFEMSDVPQNKMPVFDVFEQVYLKGIEEGLYAGFFVSDRKDYWSVEEYEEYYKGKLYDAEIIGGTAKNIGIVTGRKYGEREDSIYVLVAVEPTVVYTFYVSFPFEGLGDYEYFIANLSNHYSDYDSYRMEKEEEYKLKSYMVHAMYKKCSFCQSHKKIESYDDYIVDWEIPGRGEI